jgi:serine/threonine protein kinase
MADLSGRTILHYKILHQLGQGGMGVVYKARDTRLDRFVALKFLPFQLAASEDDKARFMREAKAASAMNHPNVCTIHSIEEYNNQLFIVMEFVEGNTLKDKKDTLSEKQILEIGIQVAEGLAAAHEKGIVHRDIKPENIMIRKDGIVQIMDFGLAKLYKSNTVSRLTKAGITVGTLGYMSPEQVQGFDVDHRTDIFSLGVVLYELFAGESPFKGLHEAAIMYEIVNTDPPLLSSVKPENDPELDRIIFECLEKEKDDRCQSAKELAKNLRKFKKRSTGQITSRGNNVRNRSVLESSETTTVATPGKASFSRIQNKNLFNDIFYNPKIFWSVAGILLITILLLVVFSSRNKAEVKVPEVKAVIPSPNTIHYDNSLGNNIAISPDGKYIAFVTVDSSGTTKLWVRPVNSLAARPLSDATNEAYPFWSPDSKSIAYFYKGKLMKLSLDAGTSLPICDITTGRGGSWSENGTIIFSPDAESGIFQVPANGGNPEEIIKPDSSEKNQSLRWEYFLPDGNHFLYSTENSVTGSSSADAVYLSSLSNTKSKKLIDVSSNSQYANGYLLYVRQGILLAQKFDPDKLQIEGETVPVTENIQYFNPRIVGTFAASQYGDLIYIEEDQNNVNTVLLDKNGNEIKKLLDQKLAGRAEFSPDGNRLAYGLYDATTQNTDVWIYNLVRDISTRLTFRKGSDLFPTWTKNGKQVLFSSIKANGIYDLYIKNADGSGEARAVLKSNFTKGATDISANGNYILGNVLNSVSSTSGWDIFLLNRNSGKEPIELMATKFNEYGAVFSPDMKWIAYWSDESGQSQIHIVPFYSPGGSNKRGGKWQISKDGGFHPEWMNNGRSVYFFTPENKIMAVDINENGFSLSPGKPYTIFDPGNIKISRLYDINPKGTEIIATVPNGQSVQSPIIMVTNWQKDIENKR